MEKIKKIIVITDCMECPKVGKCSSWKKLTPKQKFTLKTGVGIGKFILKDCPLNDYPSSNYRELLINYTKQLIRGDYNYIHEINLKVDTFLGNNKD